MNITDSGRSSNRSSDDTRFVFLGRIQEFCYFHKLRFSSTRSLARLAQTRQIIRSTSTFAEYTREYEIEKTMLNIPDYVLEEEETIRMDDEVSVDEEGELRCSDFEVPLFTSEIFIDLFLLHLKKITQEQWDYLAFGKINTATVLILTNLCDDIVEDVTVEVLEEVEPQYNSANTPVTTNDSELPKRERNLCFVTREDIEASLGDSLNQCFAEVMDVSEEKSDYSEQLRRLVAGEVARNINCRLAAQSTSSEQTEEFDGIEPPLAIEMVGNIAHIFTQNLLRRNSFETFEEEYLDSDFLCSSYQDDITILSHEYSDLSSSLLPMPPTSTREKFSKGEKTFLAVLLAKVLDHVTESTKTSILALNFDGILNDLIKTVEETSFPATCGNLHLSMYDNLCKEFGLAEYTREYEIEKTMLNIPDYQRERNLCSVTREDIEASLGDSLNQCFAEVMDVSEEKSDYSEQLRRLVAGEVARNINCRLAAQSTSSEQTEEFVEIETPLAIEMVKNISNIFTQNLLRKNSFETLEEEYLDSHEDDIITKCCNRSSDDTRFVFLGRIQEFCYFYKLRFSSTRSLARLAQTRQIIRSTSTFAEYTREYEIEKTMLNIPDYVLEEEETIRMDDEVSVDEEGELRCSDFEVPLFTSEMFIDLFLLHLKNISQEQWDYLAFGKIDTPTVLILTNLCDDIVEDVTVEVLEEVEPQYNSANTPVTTNDSELPKRERNLCFVTREDIEASLGDSLNQCFAEVMDVSEEKSDYSEQLRRLVAGEVARNINCRLAAQSTSSEQTEEFDGIEPPLAIEMVGNIAHIFTQNLLRRHFFETFEEEYLDSDFLCSSYQDDINILSHEYSDLSSSLLPMPPTSTREKVSKGEKTFLAVLLAKVLDHVTESTKTSILALNFDGILNDLIKTVEETSFPATCGNLHLSMYDNLCKEFGSAKLLQAAIMSEDLAFAEAFARELKTQLEKTSRKSPSFFTKVKSFFTRKNNKVVPVYTREYEIEKTMLNIPDYQRERNLCSVTREDIEASLGDSLNQCFAEVMDVSEEKSDYSEQLRRLVAGEVARNINCRLAAQSTSSEQTEEFVEIETPLAIEMVKNISNIFTQNLLRKNSFETLEEEYLDSHEDDIFTIVKSFFKRKNNKVAPAVGTI
ncbi:hypothetical protein D9C73_023938 [Collichthys lucidus]|uniref:Uncharacterized protein n=1 Tax=Collichthys lucidus TaxID=240159 RepID=A0A4U5VNA2_COLLU|nr:hypothetical protein D9C73_023938 [Collichthys lucidus]